MTPNSFRRNTPVKKATPLLNRLSTPKRNENEVARLEPQSPGSTAFKKISSSQRTLRKDEHNDNNRYKSNDDLVGLGPLKPKRVEYKAPASPF